MARHPRPWRPNLGNQVLEKALFVLLTKTLFRGSRARFARAGCELRDVWSPRGTNSLADAESAGCSAAARARGSRRGPGRELAARGAALINPQSVHLIPGSKPEPGREAGQRLQLSAGLLGGGTRQATRSGENEFAFLSMEAGFTWELQALRAQQLSMVLSSSETRVLGDHGPEQDPLVLGLPEA